MKTSEEKCELQKERGKEKKKEIKGRFQNKGT